MAETRRPPQLGVDHIGLSVTNLERSMAFYCDLLGAEVVFPLHPAHNFDGRRTVLSLGPQMFDINEFAANDGKAFDSARTGLDHVAFTVGSREDLDRWAHWLDGNNIDRSQIRTIDTDIPPVQIRGHMFDLLDPDGIQLEFVCVSRMELGTVTF